MSLDIHKARCAQLRPVLDPNLSPLGGAAVTKEGDMFFQEKHVHLSQWTGDMAAEATQRKRPLLSRAALLLGGLAGVGLEVAANFPWKSVEFRFRGPLNLRLSPAAAGGYRR